MGLPRSPPDAGSGIAFFLFVYAAGAASSEVPPDTEITGSPT